MTSPKSTRLEPHVVKLPPLTAIITAALCGPVLFGALAASPKPQATPGQASPSQSHAVPQWQIEAGGKMAFDAASVKLDDSGDSVGHSNLSQSGGHVALTGVSSFQLLAQAYKFASLSDAKNMMVGLPDWCTSVRFDINAEAPGNPTLDQKRLMLQSLLADRFALAVHRETRQLPVYQLSLIRQGKLGSQIRPHAGDAACGSAASGGTQAQVNGPATESPAETARELLREYPCGRVVGGLLAANDHDQIWSGGRRVDMKTIAASLGGMEPMDRPILDRTGLGGTFDFTIEWNHQLQSLSSNPASVETPGLSLLEALRQQLGLTLKAAKGPVEVLVIDHVEEPSAN